MAIILEAPYASPVVATYVPNPSFENTEAIRATMTTYRALDGTAYAYPKKTNQFDITMDFTDIARSKIIEVFEFIKAYHGMYIKFTDWNNNVWKASFLNETISSQTIARHTGLANLPEVGQFTLQLLAAKQFGDKLAKIATTNTSSMTAATTGVKL